MLNTPSAPDLRVPADAGERTSASGHRFRSLWLCLAVGLLAFAVLAWLFGLTWWTVLIAGIPIAAVGLLHPMIGVIAMTTSSLSVIGNSLLLKRAKLAAGK